MDINTKGNSRFIESMITGCGNFDLFPVCGLLCFLLDCIYEHVLKYLCQSVMIISLLCLESYDINWRRRIGFDRNGHTTRET